MMTIVCRHVGIWDQFMYFFFFLKIHLLEYEYQVSKFGKLDELGKEAGLPNDSNDSNKHGNRSKQIH